MANPDRLLKRGANWYYRRRVPADLIEVFKKKEIRFSLKTIKKAEALKLRAFADIEWDAKFDDAKIALANSLTFNEPIEFSAGVEKVKQWVEERDKAFNENRISSVGELSFEQAHDNQIENENQLYALRHHTEEGIADVSILWHKLFGISLDNLSIQQRDEIFELLRRALVDLTRRRIAVDQVDYSTKSLDPLFQHTTGSFDTIQKSPGNNSILFGKPAKMYLAEYENEKTSQGVSAKRIESMRRLIATVVEIIGAETPVILIDYELAKKCRDTIAALPKNRLKFYPKLDIPTAIQRADKDGRLPMARITQQKYLSAFKSILDHGIDRGELQFIGRVVPGQNGTR